MIYTLLFKRKLGLIPLIVLTFLLCTNHGFAMKTSADDELNNPRSTKKSKTSTSFDPNAYFQFPELKPEDIHHFIAKAENDSAAQEQLMKIYYYGLYQKVMTPQKLEFLSWNVDENSDWIDFYIYYIFVNFKDKIGDNEKNCEYYLELTEKRAAEENVYALNNLGRMYKIGWGGLPENDQETFRCYELAASKGFAVAQCNLACLYQYGLGGLVKNEAEAIRLYRQTIKQGLGVVELWQLKGFESNADAVRHMKAAAEQGFPSAQCELGVMYYKGLAGLPKNNTEAFRLLELAAHQEYALAQYYLGTLFQLKQQSVEALRWLLKSKFPAAKTTIQSLIKYNVPTQEPESVEDLLQEIVGNLGPLVQTIQNNVMENDPEGYNTDFCIPELFNRYDTIEGMVGELLASLSCLKGGCLMTGFEFLDQSVENFAAQEGKKHQFISKVELPLRLGINLFSNKGISLMNQSYITIGEQNVSNVQKLLVCFDKYSSVDQELGSIAQNYEQAYNMHLVELVKTYPEAQQTTDPVIIEKFQKLSQIVDLSKAQFNAIEQRRTTLKTVLDDVYILLLRGVEQRTRDFFEDDAYSFLK